MDVRPIRDAADYDWAPREIAADFEAARFDGLAALIEAYEAPGWPIAETMARLSLRRADLAGFCCGRWIG